MGIKRLTQFLKQDFKYRNLSEFKEKTLGVDICGWIYQAYFCQLESNDVDSLLIIRNIEVKLKLFEKYKIKGVFVFDGHKLPCKYLTSEKRKSKRQYYQDKLAQGYLKRRRRQS